MKQTLNPSDCNSVTACYTLNANSDNLLQENVTAQNFCYSKSYSITFNQGEKCNNAHRYVTPQAQQQRTQKVTRVTACNHVTGGF